MTNCGKDILLVREGTEQDQRFIDALNPASVKLNDFSLKDWMQFAYDFASHINYFDVSNDKVPDGNWQNFFKSKDDINTFLSEVKDGKDIPPHLALFVAFIKLLKISQGRFNRLSKRHLDYYYKQVLKLKKQPATPDKVYAIFELAKNAVSEKITRNTELDTGKDADNKKLIFETTDELIANQTKVASLKSFYNDHDNEKFKAATVANSFDGIGEDFPKKEIKWWPFGYFEPLNNPDTREFPELPNAQTGFALSGEILELQEGERNIQIGIVFSETLGDSISSTILKDNLEIYCTGEKGWIGPFSAADEIKKADDTVLYSSGLKSDKKTINIAFQVSKEKGAIEKYDAEIHSENYKTDFPVCRILFKTKQTAAHKLYRLLVGEVFSNLLVDVNVRGIQTLNLYNDIGSINAEKPFYPFGTLPVKKSKFYVDYAELYKKKWKDLTVNIEWKNTPSNFSSWYYAYRKPSSFNLSQLDFIKGIYTQVSNPVEVFESLTPEMSKELPNKDIGKDITIPDFEKTIQASLEKVLEWQMIDEPTNLIVDDNSYFTVKAEIKEKEEWETSSGKNAVPLFEGPTEEIFSLELTVPNPAIDQSNVGPVRLSLNQTFLHEMYPRLYALAMSSEDKTVIIPNEPYTPYIELLTLDYNASAEILIENKIYKTKEFELFHEHPFGQAKECLNLKLDNGITDKNEAHKLKVLPTYCEGGELYVGLEDAKNQQTVSLLFQVLEGSENPETESFVGKQKVEWWMLCNNEWKQLDSTSIITNDTGNLLKSGILKFTIPKEASSNNTLLPAGYMWLKARIHKKYNAVSKAIGIHAQAVEAEFSNNDNNLQHLLTGLPAETISKMVNRIPKVKGLTQPYNSFGGNKEENNEAYYRRISERLRHKNRAITIWDYEHLVLQNFPEIHKVKCLSHTCSKIANEKRKTNYLAPGSVVLVVIPDIVNKNVFDIYQPRVSMAILNKIQEFLNKLNSPLVRAQVINPEYEELRIDLKVQFYKGYDEVYYKQTLKNDLTRFLSPWAFDNTAAIRFGLSLHKSVIINYVEKLEYVDFVSDVKLHQKMATTGTETEVNVAIPSSPEAILVSSKDHMVNDAINSCVNEVIEQTETCQK